jgi:hypothetical protein
MINIRKLPATALINNQQPYREVSNYLLFVDLNYWSTKTRKTLTNL